MARKATETQEAEDQQKCAAQALADAEAKLQQATVEHNESESEFAKIRANSLKIHARFSGEEVAKKPGSLN